MNNSDVDLEAILNRLGVDIVRVLKPEEISNLLALRDKRYALNNKHLVVMLQAASSAVRQILLAGLNRFRRSRVIELLRCDLQEPTLSERADLQEIHHRFFRGIAYAMGYGLIVMPDLDAPSENVCGSAPLPQRATTPTNPRRAVKTFSERLIGRFLPRRPYEGMPKATGETSAHNKIASTF